MSRIGEDLFFAPGISFADLDFEYGHLPDQFYRRINGYYLEPARQLAHARKDFASGLLAVCAADALGGFITGSNAHRERMIGFFQSIDGLGTPELAGLFIDDFRNGLVHNARVKGGGEFSSDIRGVAVRRGKSLVVNPGLLAEAVHARLATYCAQVRRNPDDIKVLATKLRRKFAVELRG
jgi:hypothetical protein